MKASCPTSVTTSSRNLLTTRVWVESIGVVVVEATTLIGPVPPSAISQYRNAQCEDISSSDVLALEDRTFAETCAHLFRKQHLAFKSVMITMYYSPQLSQNSPTSLSSDYELRSTHSRQVRRYRSNMTLEDLRAKQSAPPMRTLPNPPGISLCGPKTTSLNQFDDVAPPYTPSYENFDMNDNYHIHPNTTRVISLGGLSNECVPSLNNLSEVLFSKKLDADVPVSPTATSSSSCSWKSPSMSSSNTSSPELYRELRIFKNCVINCCSCYRMMATNDHHDHIPHAEYVYPMEKVRSISANNTARKRRIRRFLLPQLLPRWSRRRSSNPSAVPPADLPSFFEDNQSLLKRAQSLVGRAVQSYH